MPDDLGITEGRLAACPTSPNCVSSLADTTDARHYAPALPFIGGAEASRARLLTILDELPRTRIERNERAYLHVTFRSALFRFVDDVEFLVDDSLRVIHVRSASRLGRGDFGVNRRRVEEIRRRFADRQRS
jgi:uncharacterized protein (DUF1499 family)